ALLGFFSFSVWLFYGLTAIALLRLRHRAAAVQELPTGRMARMSPYLLVIIAVAMTASLAAESPWRALTGLTMALAALPVYWVWRRWQQRHTSATG
ncbi:MAG: hypothetical protein AAB426_10025, partial [Myxococcota bacterium]